VCFCGVCNIRHFRCLEKYFSKIIAKLNHDLSVILGGALLLVFLFSAFSRVVCLSGVEVLLEWQADINNSLKIPLLLVFDWMSLFFISTVSLISARVLLYSSSYMAQENFFSRFIVLVFSFVLRIRILILRPNFISILLGWDGLGVTSYLLVIYFQSAKSYSAGMLTALTNRLGDVGLLLVIGLYAQFGSWSFFYQRSLTGPLPAFMLVILILTASTKRAQLPFSSWLPAAMAAPTPVSSLVHSSTLVTAGVYLLIRLNYMIRSFHLLWVLTGLGLLTMFIAGIRAMGELDIKKVIALSTLRQLGLMFIVLGLGLPVLAFYHLVSHAYFKAMLFMCAGAIIHTFKDYQDLRTLGGGFKSLPFSTAVFTVANLRLCGVPFMSGFFSKDLILEMLIMGGPNLFVFFVAAISTILTVIYSTRLIQMIFFGRLKSEPIFRLREIDLFIKTRITLLLGFSCVGGLGISWLLEAHCYLIFLPLWLKLLVLFIVLFSPLTLAGLPRPGRGRTFKFLQFMWFMPFLFRARFSRGGLKAGKKIYSLGDRGWVWSSLITSLKNPASLLESYFYFSFKGAFLKRLGLTLLFIFLLV